MVIKISSIVNKAMLYNLRKGNKNERGTRNNGEGNRRN